MEHTTKWTTLTPPNLSQGGSKINVFPQIVLGITSKSTFCAKLPSIFIARHKIPRRPRNLHRFTTSRSADNAIPKKHGARHVGGLQSSAPATRKSNTSSESVGKYCTCHGKRLLTRHETCWNVTKCHACHAKRSYATLETSKSHPFCRTSHRHGYNNLV